MSKTASRVFRAAMPAAFVVTVVVSLATAHCATGTDQSDDAGATRSVVTATWVDPASPLHPPAGRAGHHDRAH